VSSHPLLSCFHPSRLMPLVLAVSASIVLGCAGGTTPDPKGKVAGTVTMNGEPLTTGRINFISSELGIGAGGDVSPEGTYTLDGAIPAGEYKAFITFNIAPSKLGTPEADVLETVPAKYQSQSTSDLTAEVQDGPNTHDFDLQ